MRKPAPKSYIKFYKLILLDPTISAGARLLFAIIKAHAIKKDNCWPSVETLTNHLGCGRRTTERWINELIAKELIQVIHRFNERGEKGSREGDGVFRKTRRRELVKQFIRIL